MNKAFWLGLVGGIFGILAALFVGFVGSVGVALGSGDGGLYGLAGLGFLFSIMGIVGGMIESNKLVGGATMVIAALGILVSIGFFGVLSFILFLIGGGILLLDARKVRSPFPSTYYAAQQPSRVHSSDRMTNLNQVPPSGLGSCSNCGAPMNMAGQQFCSSCGYKLV